jgi:hypothetical protein
MRGHSAGKGLRVCAAWGVALCALLALAVAVAASPEAAKAQGTGVPPFQSLQPTPSPCSAGSQSVRVCNNDFQSCSSVCTANALDPNADIAGCSLRCCTQYNTCLRLRQCGPRTINCF